ncbi:MAG: DUF4203 domain-containing protein [Anaerolineae bacterium]|nr:DUF4203 domain-containing protein [Anaerolineae bacterium]
MNESAPSLIWGLVAIVCGGFFAIYGFSLFRVSLFAIGLLVGFSLGMIVTQGQNDVIRLIISLVAGGILGVLFYTLFKISLYIAGGVLGLVIALLIASLFTMHDSVLQTVAVIIGLLVGGFFGRFLGDFIIILATSIVGAYAIIYGLATLFPQTLGTSSSGLIPINWLSIVLLVTFGLISGLAQHQILSLRRRLRRTPLI